MGTYYTIMTLLHRKYSYISVNFTLSVKLNSILKAITCIHEPQLT